MPMAWKGEVCEFGFSKRQITKHEAGLRASTKFAMTRSHLISLKNRKTSSKGPEKSRKVHLQGHTISVSAQMPVIFILDCDWTMTGPFERPGSQSNSVPKSLSAQSNFPGFDDFQTHCSRLATTFGTISHTHIYTGQTQSQNFFVRPVNL